MSRQYLFLLYLFPCTNPHNPFSISTRTYSLQTKSPHPTPSKYWAHMYVEAVLVSCTARRMSLGSRSLRVRARLHLVCNSTQEYLDPHAIPSGGFAWGAPPKRQISPTIITSLAGIPFVCFVAPSKNYS